MRRSAVNSVTETYSMNYVFDDVTHQFNGITSSYTLKQNELNTTGFSTDNGIILVNNIFQVPEGSDW